MYCAYLSDNVVTYEHLSDKQNFHVTELLRAESWISVHWIDIGPTETTLPFRKQLCHVEEAFHYE